MLDVRCEIYDFRSGAD